MSDEIGLAIDEEDLVPMRQEVELSLSLDEEDKDIVTYTLKLFDDSPFRKVAASEIFNTVVDAGIYRFRVVDVIDYDAWIEANPGPACRLIKVRQE